MKDGSLMMVRDYAPLIRAEEDVLSVVSCTKIIIIKL
jgi:hypothetical protein